MTLRLRIEDPALRRYRRLIAKAVGAGAVSGPMDAYRPQALVASFALEHYRRARAQCLARGLRLFLAAPGPFGGRVETAFAEPASLLCIELSPEVLRRATTPGRALRLALLEMAGSGETSGEWRRLRPLLGRIDPDFVASGRAFPDAGPQSREAEEEARQKAAKNGEPSPAELLVLRALRFPDPYRPSGFLPPADALQALDAAARHGRENALPAFCAGAKSWNRAAIAAAFGSAHHPVTFCARVEEAIDRAAAVGGRVICWAAASSHAVEAFAEARKVPLLRIEDGFLRSVGLGAGLVRGASFAVDDLGIYFDATRPSRMEERLNGARFGEEEIARGARLREMIVAQRVTKYNVGSRRLALDLPGDREVLLVPGQVADDAGIRKSVSPVIDCQTTENVNLDLLRLVRARNPKAHILFKPHPDVQAGLRRGRVAQEDLKGLADQVVAGIDILELLDLCDRVETFSSLAGFEALLRLRPVTVYGMPFYAGWGLTDDVGMSPRRNARRTIDELVHVAFVDYIRCIDPLTLKPCSPEYLIGQLARLRTSRLHGVKARALRDLSWLGRKLGL